MDTAGRLRFRPHPGQLRAWRSERRFIFMLAGTQGGKTSFGPHWLYREMQRCGPGDYLAVTSTFPLLKLKMLPEFLRLFQHTLELGEWRAVDKVFEFSRDGARRTFGRDGQARVIFGSATNSDSLESATAKAAWLDEVGQDDFRVESWEAVIRRLSLSQGRVLAGTTIYNLGWLKQVIYDRATGDADIEIIQFDSIDNPAFPRAEYERAERNLPTWKFKMFYRGQFDRPAGMIYSDFIDEYREAGGHKVRPFDLPSAWPRYIGVDFGAVNTATVWLARDPDADLFYLYRESHAGGLSSSGHAAQARAAAGWREDTGSYGVNVVSWHGGAKGEDQQRMDWTAAGVPVQPPVVVDVEAGIDRVIELLKTWRLYVFDTCAGVLDEFGSYSRELDEMNEPTEKIKHKERYHRLDALRYVAQAVVAAPSAGGWSSRPAAMTMPQRRPLFGGRR